MYFLKDVMYILTLNCFCEGQRCGSRAHVTVVLLKLISLELVCSCTGGDLRAPEHPGAPRGGGGCGKC